jgi:hypothetical protein
VLLQRTTLQVDLALEVEASAHLRLAVAVCLVRTSLLQAVVFSEAVPRPPTPQHHSEVVQLTPAAHSASQTLVVVVSSVKTTTRRPLPQPSVPTTHRQTLVVVSLAVAALQVEASGKTTHPRLKTRPLAVYLAVVVDLAKTTTTNKSLVASLAAQALVPVPQVAASSAEQTRVSRLLAVCSVALLPTTQTTILEAACLARSLLLAVVPCLAAATTPTLERLAEAYSVALVTTTTSKTQEVVVSSAVARTTTNRSLAACLAAPRTTALEAVSSVVDLANRTTANRTWAALCSSRNNSSSSNLASTTACSVPLEALC